MKASVHTPPLAKIGFSEFIMLMALMTSLTALNIDAMLPALPDIGLALQVTHENQTQLIISVVFLGMAFGQLFYGPFADSHGRKPAVYLGLFCFFLGSVMCLLATDIFWMLMGRLLQGFGLAAPRTVTMAIVRDQFNGDDMARVMSFIMAVFIIVPALAPAIGQGIIWLSDWKMIFVFFIVLAAIAGVWFAIRQPETLKPEHKRTLSRAVFWQGIKEIFGNQTVMAYVLGYGFITACLIVYLSLAQQIFQAQYELGAYFPLVFAGIALSIGLASYINGKLVSHYGARPLSKVALINMIVMSALMLPLALIDAGHPSLIVFLFYCAVTMFSVGILFGNLASLAMEPLGHMAGLGAAIVGAMSSLIAIPLGVSFAYAYDNSILPLVSAFLVFSVLTWLAFAKASKPA